MCEAAVEMELTVLCESDGSLRLSNVVWELIGSLRQGPVGRGGRPAGVPYVTEGEYRWQTFHCEDLCSGCVYFYVCLICMKRIVLRIYFYMLLVCLALRGCVSCGSITYDPHCRSSFPDPASQTVQSAGPPVYSI